MDLHETRGWKNRRRLADMKRADWQDDDRAAVRAQRERMKQEADAANRAATEAADAALTAAECRCTACGGTGMVRLEKAAAIVEALHSYGFQGYRPSKAMVAALDSIARGIEVPTNLPVIAFTYGSYSPAPTGAVAPEPPASALVEPIAKPSKSSRRDSFTDDGALIEV